MYAGLTSALIVVTGSAGGASGVGSGIAGEVAELALAAVLEDHEVVRLEVGDSAPFFVRDEDVDADDRQLDLIDESEATNDLRPVFGGYRLLGRSACRGENHRQKNQTENTL
jgi:hypothetical protein